MTAVRTRPWQDRHASLPEVARAIAALGEADYARLAKVAKLRARGLAQVEWQDLLHDAVRRALDGTRRWPADIPFPLFLREVIRSLASEAWRLQGRERQLRTDASVEEILSNAAGPGDPERSTLDQNLVAKLEEVFAGDNVALGILTCLAEGLTPGEILSGLNIDQTNYDSARRRIRRRIAAAPEVFQ